MLFGRRKTRAPSRAGRGEGPSGSPAPVNVYRIDFEMMLKGSVYERREGPVRQAGVTVDGATRIVTSGEMVDKETYEALVKAGVIEREPEATPKAGDGAKAEEVGEHDGEAEEVV